MQNKKYILYLLYKMEPILFYSAIAEKLSEENFSIILTTYILNIRT